MTLTIVWSRVFGAALAEIARLAVMIAGLSTVASSGELLAERLQVAHEAGTLCSQGIKRVTVDTPCSRRSSASQRTPSFCMLRSGG